MNVRWHLKRLLAFIRAALRGVDRAEPLDMQFGRYGRNVGEVEWKLPDDPYLSELQVQAYQAAELDPVGARLNAIFAAQMVTNSRHLALYGHYCPRCLDWAVQVTPHG